MRPRKYWTPGRLCLGSAGGKILAPGSSLVHSTEALSRVCPGRSLADNNLWLVLSRMIATMDIGKARDNEGKEITPLFTYTSGIVR